MAGPGNPPPSSLATFAGIAADFATDFVGDFGGFLGHAGGSTPEGVIPAVRDADIFREVVRILKATAQFSYVGFGEPPESWGAGSQLKSIAVVLPGAADESVGFDNEDASEILRKVSYTLEIRVRADDPAERFDRADRLCQAARKALNGVSLCGATYPPLTNLRGDTQGKVSAPERIHTLRGTFTYSIDDVPTGRDVAFT